MPRRRARSRSRECLQTHRFVESLGDEAPPAGTPPAWPVGQDPEAPGAMRHVDLSLPGRLGERRWVLAGGRAPPTACDPDGETPPALVSLHTLDQLRRGPRDVARYDDDAYTRSENIAARLRPTRPMTREVRPHAIPRTARDVVEMPTDVVGRIAPNADGERAEAAWHVIMAHVTRVHEDTLHDVERAGGLRQVPAVGGWFRDGEREQEQEAVGGGNAPLLATHVAAAARAADSAATAVPLVLALGGEGPGVDGAEAAAGTTTYANVHTECVTSAHVADSLLAAHGPFPPCVAGDVCRFYLRAARYYAEGWRPDAVATAHATRVGAHDASVEYAMPPLAPGCMYLSARDRAAVVAAHAHDSTYRYHPPGGGERGFCYACITYVQFRRFAEVRRAGAAAPPLRTFNALRVAVGAGSVGAYRHDAVVPAEVGAMHGVYGHIRVDDDADYVPGVAVGVGGAHVFCLRERPELLFSVAAVRSASPRPDAGGTLRPLHVEGVVVRLPAADVLTVASWKSRALGYVTAPLLQWLCRPLAEAADDLRAALEAAGGASACPTGILPATRFLTSADVPLAGVVAAARAPAAAARAGGSGGSSGGGSSSGGSDASALAAAIEAELLAVEEGRGGGVGDQAAVVGDPVGRPVRRPPAEPPAALIPEEVLTFFDPRGAYRRITAPWTAARLAQLDPAMAHGGVGASAAAAAAHACLLVTAQKAAVLEHLHARNRAPDDGQREHSCRAMDDWHAVLAWFVDRALRGGGLHDAALAEGCHPALRPRAGGPPAPLPLGVRAADALPLPTPSATAVPGPFLATVWEQWSTASASAAVTAAAAAALRHTGVVPTLALAEFLLGPFDHVARAVAGTATARQFVVAVCAAYPTGWAPRGSRPTELWTAVELLLAARVRALDAALAAVAHEVIPADVYAAMARGERVPPPAGARMACLRLRDAHAPLALAVCDARSRAEGGSCVGGGARAPPPTPDDAAFPTPAHAVWRGALPRCGSALRALAVFGSDAYQLRASKHPRNKHVSVTRVLSKHRQGVQALSGVPVVSAHDAAAVVAATARHTRAARDAAAAASASTSSWLPGGRPPPRKRARKATTRPAAARPAAARTAAARKPAVRTPAARTAAPSAEPAVCTEWEAGASLADPSSATVPDASDGPARKRPRPTKPRDGPPQPRLPRGLRRRDTRWADASTLTQAERGRARGAWRVWCADAAVPLVSLFTALVPWRDAASVGETEVDMARVASDALRSHVTQGFVVTALRVWLAAGYEWMVSVPTFDDRCVQEGVLNGDDGPQHVLAFLTAAPTAAAVALRAALAALALDQRALLDAAAASGVREFFTACAAGTESARVGASRRAATPAWTPARSGGPLRAGATAAFEEAARAARAAAGPVPTVKLAEASLVEAVRWVRGCARTRRVRLAKGVAGHTPPTVDASEYAGSTTWQRTRELVATTRAGVYPAAAIFDFVVDAAWTWGHVRAEQEAPPATREELVAACKAAYEVVLRARDAPLVDAVDALVTLPTATYLCVDGVLRAVEAHAGVTSSYIADAATVAAQRAALLARFRCRDDDGGGTGGGGGSAGGGTAGSGGGANSSLGVASACRLVGRSPAVTGGGGGGHHTDAVSACGDGGAGDGDGAAGVRGEGGGRKRGARAARAAAETVRHVTCDGAAHAAVLTRAVAARPSRLPTRVLPEMEAVLFRQGCEVVATQVASAPVVHPVYGLAAPRAGAPQEEKRNVTAYGALMVALCDQGYHHCHAWVNFLKRYQAIANQVAFDHDEGVGAGVGADGEAVRAAAAKRPREILSRDTKLSCEDFPVRAMPALGRVLRVSRWYRFNKVDRAGGAALVVSTCCGRVCVAAHADVTRGGVRCGSCTPGTRRSRTARPDPSATADGGAGQRRCAVCARAGAALATVVLEDGSGRAWAPHAAGLCNDCARMLALVQFGAAEARGAYAAMVVSAEWVACMPPAQKRAAHTESLRRWWLPRAPRVAAVAGPARASE